MSILLAMLLGALFGFVLHKVGATDPQRIIGMLRLSDLHLMKVILFAIGVASIGLFGLSAVGLIDPAQFSVKASHVGVLIGGALFGIGFAVVGYCPGTAVCALGTGRKDALAFVVGGLVGAWAFMLVYGALVDTPLLAGLGGTLSLAETGDGNPAVVTAAPGWLIAGAIGVVLMVIARLLPSTCCARPAAKPAA
jgi:uncharacterized membrane protein YedE/YeeE